jgi:chemotaxis signal transduction protein
MPTAGGVSMVDGLQRFLVFSVRGHRFALDLQDIAEVVESPSLFPAPWAPGFFRGAMNFHGSVVAVLDLAGFLDLGAADREEVVLVLDKRIANLALAADSVENIVPSDLILETGESDDPLVERIFMTDDGEIRLLATGKLLEEIEAGLRV